MSQRSEFFAPKTRLLDQVCHVTTEILMKESAALVKNFAKLANFDGLLDKFTPERTEGRKEGEDFM